MTFYTSIIVCNQSFLYVQHDYQPRDMMSLYVKKIYTSNVTKNNFSSNKKRHFQRFVIYTCIMAGSFKRGWNKRKGNDLPYVTDELYRTLFNRVNLVMCVNQTFSVDRSLNHWWTQLCIGECQSNSPFLKNNGAEAHCF